MDKFGFEPSSSLRKLITMSVSHQSDAVSHLNPTDDGGNLADLPNLRVVIAIEGDNMLLEAVEDLGDFQPLTNLRARYFALKRRERGEAAEEGDAEALGEVEAEEEPETPEAPAEPESKGKGKKGAE